MGLTLRSDGLELESVFVARQPIFDRDENIWGYELLFRSSQQAGTSCIVDDDNATSRVIADGFMLAGDGLSHGSKLLINFPARMLVEDAAFALPPDMCVIEILETVRPEPEVIAALRRLKDAGYTLALDDFVGQPGFEPILGMADIVKVDILGRSPKDVIGLYKQLKPYGCKLLAEKIETVKIYELTRQLGFEFFQGFFFCKPTVITGKKISSSELSKLQLLERLGHPDYDVNDLAQIIAVDISLSYRLLRYINSAAFSLRAKIESVRQAIVLLGQKQLAQWLRVVVMSDLSNTRKTGELAFVSAKRARFLELMAAKTGMPSESMFLLGLFSLLDAILGQPMEEVMRDLPLDDDIRDALLGKNSKVLDWLKLVETFDRADWEKLDAALDKLHLDPESAANSHAQAMAWAAEILGLSTPEDEAPKPRAPSAR